MTPLFEPARSSAAWLRPLTILLRLALVLGLASLGQIACAQEGGVPAMRLGTIFPAGGQQGTALDVEVSGFHFDSVNQLHFSDPGISAHFQPVDPAAPQDAAAKEAAAKDVEKYGKSQKFRVTIAPQVKPGVYDVRAIGPQGVSNPRAFVVGSRSELLEVEPNNQPGQATEIPLGSVVNGRTDPQADVDYFRFHAQAGQRVILDCSAYRIDSRLDAVLVLYNSAGEELDRSHDYLRRDPLIDFTAPADGQYLAAVHDLVYAGSRRHVYRLSIGVDPHLDFVFPPAGMAGSDARYRLFGRNLPGGQPAGILTVDGKPLETLEVAIPLPGDAATQQITAGSLSEPVEIGIDGVEFQIDSPAGPSNPVLVSLATAPIVVEQQPNDEPSQAQSVGLPCECVGQFYPRGDRDWFSFEAHKGDSYWIEVFAQRLGLPADPLLVVQQVVKNEAGVETVTDVATVDDEGANPAGDLFFTAGDDPVYPFVAPADGTYRVMVTDLAGTERSDPWFVYRLSIRSPHPDFRLVAVPRFPPNLADIGKVPPTVWNPSPRRGGADLIEIVALRRDGFDGEIAVTATGLPSGITAPAITIGPGQTLGALVLSAAENAGEIAAAENAAAGIGALSITGTARIGGADVVRAARPATMVSAGVHNIVTPRSRLARDLIVGVTGGDLSPLALDVGASSVLEMARPGIVKFPVNLIRRGEFKGAVTLAALSLPPDATLKEAVTIEPDKSSGELEIKLGKNTPLGVYSLCVIAMADVPAAVFTPGKGGTLKLGVPSPPLKLTVTGTAIRLQVAAPTEPVRAGTKVELPITLERLYDYADPVQVRVIVPNELNDIRSAILTIPRGKSDGKLAVTLGEGATLGAHRLTVNAIARLGGQELPTTQEIVLTVEPAPAAAPETSKPD
jgi:hypothetical protein